MNKYVIYNPDDDTYLNCGTSIHNISVEDVNDATLFNTLNEIWELLSDFEYSIKPVVLAVTVDVTPDHTIDHYLIKKEIDEAVIADALEGGAFSEEAKETLKDIIAGLHNKERMFNHRDMQNIQDIIDTEIHEINVPLENEYKDDAISKTHNSKSIKKERNVFNPSDSEYI